ncbi:MAG: crosslink repair DNA glycosylase YcaQ family protein, partial [Steroidobacteraceae bacterium]
VSAVSLSEALRIALDAQQIGSGKASPATVRRMGDIVRRLGVIQIDSVNVLVRSHFLPVYSRYGSYPMALLERAAYEPKSRCLFEYWGHEASLLPIESFPLFRWRMDQARRGEGTWKSLRRYATEHKQAVDAVREEIRARGPLGAGDLIAAERSKGGWWGWSESKEILEWLFWSGQVTTAGRRNFERLYDLTERVIPDAIFSPPPLSKEDQQRELMTIAARAAGVGTVKDLRDYFRLPVADAGTRVQELVEAGVLVPVAVEGWKQQGYMHRDARCPRKVAAVALLSPFDSLIWERQRTERLFDFHFRLEIYTPLHKRVHGYYVLPLLMDERIVARVDLKSDRAASRLLVRGGSVEAGVEPAAVVAALAEQLQKLAEWLGLERFVVATRRGDLMKLLRQLRL